MSVAEKYLDYRGQIRALAASGKWLAFVTEHPEGRPTALYRLDCESFELASDPLPCGARALGLAGDAVWVGGADGALYRGSLSGGKPSRVLAIEGGPPSALAPLAGDRLAVAAGPRIAIIDVGAQGGTPLQALELPADATCLAADPTGRWLVAGTSTGAASVFTSEGREDFLLSESSKLHEGAVTALLFDPDELRFLSSGADRKLLSTLARGTLEPEDRGKSVGHEDVITSLAWAPGDRLLTGALDSTVKTWPRSGGARPATLKDGVAKVRALAVVTAHERPRLVVACEDNTLRLFVLDAAGKFGDATARLHDATARARHELAEGDPRRREAALDALARAGDAASVELLAEHSRADADPALRLAAARLLGEADHPRSVPLLEGLLDHFDESVRRLAFERLLGRSGGADLRPIDLALKTARPEVGRLAVEALTPLARRDDQALDRLLAALDAKEWEVRRAAASALEAIHPGDSPEAGLIALNAKHADLRRWALGRLLHRGLLDRPEVATALRRRAEDRDADVRRVAFLMMLHTRPRLLALLRARDADLDRQLADLDADAKGQGGAADEAGAKARPRSEAKKAAKPARKAAKGKADAAAADGLHADDLAPLLNAAASRALDTALRGARGLALLGDPRAFGLLLQLSREAEPSARVEVCRALASLGDDAANNRLRSLLHDDAPEVRDAAFSALAAIDRDAPLRAAEAGLNADHDDVRRRGLQLLLAEARKAPPASADSPIGRLLVRALNDASPAIRAEAFKATLNLPAAGGGAGALRFARRSIHADVRREVLTEVVAQRGEAWAWDLLLEAFDDPDPDLRAEAFAAASAKSKGLEVPEAALGSRFPDLRAKAVAGLVKTHSAAAQALLARALDDEDRGVRLAAIEALVSEDARARLASALEGPRADVRVRAASALARHGDRGALGPLVALAAAPEPAESERRADWLDLAGLALDGLAELGDPEAIVPVFPLLDSPHAPLRKGAAGVLCWCATPGAADPLRQALAHADPHVKYRAAMGLALLGDAATAPLLDSPEGAGVLGRDDRLAVAVAMGDEGEGRLVLALDDPDAAVRDRALLALVCRELKAPRGDASRLIAALSSREARVRLVAADALRSAHDPVALRAAATRMVNDRGDEAAWTLPEATIDALADLLATAPPRVRARAAARLLPPLDPGVKEQAAFELAFAAFSRRFAGAIAEAGAAAPAPTATAIPAEELAARAFGAYVGLAREQAGKPAGKGKKGKSREADPAAEAAAARVRRSAIDRLRALADADPTLTNAVAPVLAQALADPNQVVRLAAFDHLAALGADPTALGAEALGAGRTDVGVRGLELLSGAAGGGEAGRSVLERVMMSRKDDLAAEAARLLADRLGRAAVAAKAIGAASDRLRLLAVSWLSEAGPGDAPAREALRLALDSRYAAVRRAAAVALAEKKDASAFDALVRLLGAAVEQADQAGLIAAFEALGDPRAAAAFLDRLEDDPAGTAPAEALIPAASRFRRPEDAPRLLSLMERERKWRALAFDAVLAISGHDQRVVDPDDTRPDDRRWMDAQHPRRDAVLAALLDRCLSLGETRLLARAIAPARWALGPEVDEPLGRAAAHPDDGPRRDAIQAIGWRLRKRSGPADPLLRALQHPDPTAQFLAAEGLALGGRAEGMSVLLSAVDFLPDLDLRRRAVAALGELGDARAFDRVLQLAGEHGHALQDAAAEAVGRLGRGARAKEVFALLDRQSRSPGSVAERAVKGLRWLGTREAWARIREVADGAEAPGLAAVALDLLASDDEPATRDLLLRHVRESYQPKCFIALRSLRRLAGPDDLEPDEAAARHPAAVFTSIDTWRPIQIRFDLPYEAPLDRLRERADAARLLALLPRCAPATAEAIQGILLDRPDPPVAEARAALGGEDPLAVAAAARILGRAKDAKSGPGLAEALARWTAAWEAFRDSVARESRVAYGRAFRPLAEGPGGIDTRGLASCLAALAWAAGRTGSGAAELARSIASERASRPDGTDPAILRSAAEALALFESPPAAAIDALEGLALDGPAGLRPLAADALARLDAGRAARVAPALIGDPVGFDRLAARAGDRLGDVLAASADRPHAQGVAVPHLVAAGELEPLAAAAADRSLPDAARLGAVEGLAGLATEAAEDHLRRVGLDEASDELVRKAAWRALRRSKRARDRSRRPRRREVTP